MELTVDGSPGHLPSLKDFYGLLFGASMVLPHDILVICLKIGYYEVSVSTHAVSMSESNNFHGIPGSTHAFHIGFLPLPMLFLLISNKLPAQDLYVFVLAVYSQHGGYT